ncbi:MAG: hypothetical protein MUO52_16380, partial [Desulfobacterales bacterium]|nr:hypothetical protein [Desulfobacterales bacterium]
YMFKELRGSLGLPRVGERVRSKDFDTVWKVIEEKETWIEDPTEPGKEQALSRLLPAIHLRYWKKETSNGPGTGKTLSYRYSHKDPSFKDHWEILYDW